MWRFERNPAFIQEAYSTNDPVRMARDVIIGEYSRKSHEYNFRPLYISSRGHSGSRCLSWIVANLDYYFGRVYNLSGDSYHTTPEIRRIQNVSDPLHDAIIDTCVRYLRSGDHVLNPQDLIEKYSEEIERLKSLFEKQFLDGYNPENQTGWCWKDTDSYIIFPIFYEVLKPYDPLILHLVRDGRDIAFKIHRTDSIIEQPGSALMRVLGLDEDTPQYLRAARSWAFQVSQHLAWQSIGDVMVVKYEEMCGDPAATIEQILARLDVPTGLYDARKIAKPIYNDRIAQYKNEDQSLINNVESVNRTELAQYGYLK